MSRWRTYLAPVVLGAGLALAAPGIAQDGAEDTEMSAQERRDRGILKNFLENRLSNSSRTIEIKGFQGALSSKARIEELTISDGEGVWLVLRGAVLDWNRAALLRGRVSVDELSAEVIELPRAPVPDPDRVPSAQAQGFSLPELPVAIRIGELSADRVVLGEALFGETASVNLKGSMVLAGGEGAAEFVAERLDSARGTFDLVGSYDNDSRQLSVDLAFDEGEDGLVSTLLDIPGRPELALKIQGEGPLSDFTAGIGLASDGETRLQGNVHIADVATEQGAQGDAVAQRYEVALSGTLEDLLNPQFRPFFGAYTDVNVAAQRWPDGRLEVDNVSVAAQSLGAQAQFIRSASGLPEMANMALRIGGQESTVRVPAPGGETRLEQAEISLQFDAEAGPDWVVDGLIEGLDRPDFRAETVRITGGGRIGAQEGAGAAQGISALIDIAAEQLQLTTREAEEAFGQSVTAQLDLVSARDRPTVLRGLTVTGETYDLSANGRLQGLNTGLRLDGEAQLSADNLAAFSGLARRPLEGTVDVQASGSAQLLGGIFDISATGRGHDLAIGEARIDPVIGGESVLDFRVRRDEEGTVIDRIIITTAEADVLAQGRIAPGQGRLWLDARLADAAVLAEGLTGDAEIDLKAEETDGIWDIALVADTDPAVLKVDGALSGLDEDYDAAPVLKGQVALDAPGLSQLSTLLGREMGGALELRLDGQGALDGGSARAVLTGTAQDLELGVPGLAQLMAGVSEIGAEVTRNGDALVVDALDVINPGFEIRGAAQVSDFIEAPDANVSLDVKSQDMARFGGLLRREMGGALDARLTGRVKGDLGALNLKLKGDAEDLRFGPEGTVPLLEGPSELLVELQRDGTTGALDRLQVRSGNLRADLSGTAENLPVVAPAPDHASDVEEPEEGASPSVPPTITAKGDLSARDLTALSALVGQELGGALDATVDGRFATDLSALNLTFGGTAQDLRIGSGAPLLAGDASFDLDAAREGARADLRRVVVQSDNLAADVSGAVEGLDTHPVADLEGEIDLRDLTALDSLPGPRLGGALRLNGRGRAARDLSVFDLDVTGNGQDITLGGVPLLAGQSDLTLRARRDGEAVDIEDLRLSAANASAEATGRVTALSTTPLARLDRFAVRVDDLTPFGTLIGQPLGGALSASGSGRVAADLSDVDLTLDGTARDLRVGPPALAPLLAGQAGFGLDVTRSGDRAVIDRAQLTADNMALRARGAVETLSGQPRLDLDEVSVRVDSLAPFSALAGRELAGAVQAEGRVSARMTGDFDAALEGTAQNLRSGQPEVDQLLAGNAVFRVDAARNGEVLLLRNLSAQTGAAQLTAQGALGTGAGEVTLDASLVDIAPFVDKLSGPVTLAGTVAQGDTVYRVDLRGTGPEGAVARAQGSVARRFDTANLAIEGLAPLSLANPWIEPRSIVGKSAWDLRLDGPLSLDAVSGTVTIADGRTVTPRLGLVVEDIAGQVALSGGRATLDLGAAMQGGGRLALSGPVGLMGARDADLALQLEQVRILDPDYYEAIVSGRLTLSGPLEGGARIAGDVEIEDAELRVPLSGAGQSYVLTDLQHVGEPPDVRLTRDYAGLRRTARDAARAGANVPRLPYPLDITLRAPNRIFARGRGLDAELGGEIRFTGTTDAVIPSGQFNLIRGRFDVLGERLRLREGNIALEGDFLPWVRFLAEAETADLLVRVLIEGKVNDPEITFSSLPELPQEEVLSHLLFNRGVANISVLQAAQLASAAASLAGYGDGGVLTRMREGFGLDDLDVTADEEGNVGVRAGKYVTENVYTDVEVESTGETAVNLNLDLSDSVTVRGRTSSDGESSLGIFFERDY